MNIITLTGNNVRDIELTYSPQGTAFAKGTIAVQRNYKDQNGEYKTDFINFKSIGKISETIANYVKKGDRFGISGQLHIDQYEKDGVKQFYTEVVVSTFDFPSKSNNAQNSSENQQPNTKYQPNQQNGAQGQYGGNNQQYNQQNDGQSVHYGQQQPNYNLIDNDPFASSKAPIEVSEDDLPF